LQPIERSTSVAPSSASAQNKRRGLAAFDLPSLRLGSWQPRLDIDPWSNVKALALVDETLSVAGDLKALNGQPRQAFGEVSAKSGRTVGTASFSSDRPPRKFAKLVTRREEAGVRTR
jgi:hypothetical protein